jgi:hypothetical protein
LLRFRPELELGTIIKTKQMPDINLFAVNDSKYNIEVGLRTSQVASPVKFNTEFRLSPNGHSTVGLGITFGDY